MSPERSVKGRSERTLLNQLRSIKPDGSIGFTLLNYQNPTRKWTVLD
jgi:hypothetical protein